MLRVLDPHSVFFDPDQFAQLRELERATRKGFGSVVSVLPGRVIVLQTLPGTPSARSGIQPGDEILAINGIRLDWLEMGDLVQLLSASRQREAHLDVRRPGSNRLLQFVMTPEDVESMTVDRAYVLEPDLAYIRISSFEGRTAEEFRDALNRLGGAALRGLILDLRDNTGGLLATALECAALLLPPGRTLAVVRGRATQAEEIKAPESVATYDFPLAVLVNHKTASGSEIVAGAVQDHDRGVVLGEKSFGKGLVQSVYPLSHGAGLALTTAYYYTPLGRPIQQPLRGTQLKVAMTPREEDDPAVAFSWREESGGIRPDVEVLQDPITRLQMVMEATGSFTAFAAEYLRRGGEIPPSEERVSASVLDDFQVYLSQRNIRPGVGEWSTEREWVRSRLLQEIRNLAEGVSSGDEVEVRRDPVVRRALELLRGRRPPASGGVRR